MKHQNYTITVTINDRPVDAGQLCDADRVKLGTLLAAGFLNGQTDFYGDDGRDIPVFLSPGRDIRLCEAAACIAYHAGLGVANKSLQPPKNPDEAFCEILQLAKAYEKSRTNIAKESDYLKDLEAYSREAVNNSPVFYKPSHQTSGYK